MNDVITIYQHALVYGCVFALAVLAAVVLLHVCGRALRTARRSLRPAEVAVFALLAGFFCLAAQKRLVSYPRTDPTQAYLVDRGSYVDSETGVVHIDFDRIIVPDTALMFIDRRRREEGAEWENMVAEQFRDVPLPYETSFEDASDWEYIVYTDWTPGPAVQTNGVWHANWARDRRTGAYIIPLRTAVRVDGETIATPKSKEDARDE